MAEIYWTIWGVIACFPVVAFIYALAQQENDLLALARVLLVVAGVCLVPGALIHKSIITEITPRKIERIKSENITIAFHEDIWESSEEAYIYGLPDSLICLSRDLEVNCYGGDISDTYTIIKCKK